MDKGRLLIELSGYEPFKAYVSFLKEREESLRSEASTYAATNPQMCANCILRADEIKNLWPNFRSSYETQQQNEAS